MNAHHKVRLHSHDVKYGSGSGQQSVTGTDVKEDVNSHWSIKGKSELTEIESKSLFCSWHSLRCRCHPPSLLPSR